MTGVPRPVFPVRVGLRSAVISRLGTGATLVLACLLTATLAPPAKAQDEAAASKCGTAEVAPAAPTSKQIDLVIDDSGSMFKGGRDRWSFAKYSLEVFGGLLRPEDTLKVYRMSDFADGSTAGPELELSGTEDTASRVAQIHEMALNGGETPYAPVQTAMDDLAQSSSPEKWLVVLTDGEFDDRLPDQVFSDLKAFVAANRSKDEDVKVAFLSLGPEAVTIDNSPEDGIYFAKVARSQDLLRQMNEFSNRIFERDSAPGLKGNSWSPDIPLDRVYVLAQGRDVSIGSVKTPTGDIAPDSVIDVKWAENAPVGAKSIEAIPNTDLQGKLATFTDLPKGDLTFDIQNADELGVFYEPKVDFALRLLDAQGNVVEADKVVGGDYKIEYGFVDENCEIVESPLLGKVEYEATITQGDGQPQVLKSGETVTLQRGEVRVDVGAQYLDGKGSASASSQIQVQQPAAPVEMTATQKSYKVSDMAEFPPRANAIPLQYVVDEGGQQRPFRPEEWATVDPKKFSVTSDSNLEFEVIKEDEVGSLTLLVRAPGGDVYNASTGDIPLTITGSHTFDGQTSQAVTTVDLEVVNDLSTLDRFINWFKNVGWKLLLLALLLILLLGYLMKKRFSRKMRRRPTIVGTPQQIGMSPLEATGKFRVNGGRRYLPFVADKATLTYVPPGTPGFRPMKLKAGPRKSMVVTNWRQIAERDNTAINGNAINEQTRRAPSFGPGSTITASTPQMTYDMTPNV